MEHWITDMIDQYGYLGIGFLIALENLFPPIPSEVILTFGGFATTQTSLSVFGVIVASTVGSVVGAVILYAVGAWLNVSRLEHIVDRYGRWLRLKRSDIQRTFDWFGKYGYWAVFICRFVPLIRSLISIPAGSIRMRFGPFLLLTLIGSALWNTALVSIGAAVGASWEDIVGYMDTYSNIVYVGLALLVLVVAALYVKKRLLDRNRE